VAPVSELAQPAATVADKTRDATRRAVGGIRTIPRGRSGRRFIETPFLRR
jgi:hypothetical protein